MSNQYKARTTKVSEIARHFGLSTETTRKILKEAGITPASQNPARYFWRDVWLLEGVGFVAADQTHEFEAPLLKATDVCRRFFPHLAPRTITDRASKGSLPAIRLGTDWRFRECEIREAAIHG